MLREGGGVAPPRWRRAGVVLGPHLGRQGIDRRPDAVHRRLRPAKGGARAFRRGRDRGARGRWDVRPVARDVGVLHPPRSSRRMAHDLAVSSAQSPHMQSSQRVMHIWQSESRSEAETTFVRGGRAERPGADLSRAHAGFSRSRRRKMVPGIELPRCWTDPPSIRPVAADAEAIESPADRVVSGARHDATTDTEP